MKRRLHDCGVLDRADDKMPSADGRFRRDAQQCQVVGFGCAAGEDDRIGRSVDQRGNLPPRSKHGLPRLADVRDDQTRMHRAKTLGELRAAGGRRLSMWTYGQALR